MKIVFLALLILIGAATANAQTVSVNISRTALLWNWEPALESGDVDDFIIKCGSQTGNYTRTTAVGPTLREIPLKSIIDGPGNWFCIVVAANTFGESEASNEVPFVVGGKPVGKITTTLKGL